MFVSAKIYFQKRTNVRPDGTGNDMRNILF